MSGVPPDDAPTNIRALPQAERDELRASYSNLVRTMEVVAENAAAIARQRKTMFDAYTKAGFTEGQALELVRGAGGYL